MGNFMGRMIKSSLIAATTSLIANVLNLDDTKVGKILGFAIPMITFFVADDPSISDLIFRDAKKKKKERDKKRKERERGGFLAKDEEEKRGLFRRKEKEAEEEFFNVFGDKGRGMSRFIAEETGTTEEEVNGVLGMTFSIMEASIGRMIEDDDMDEKEFNRRIKAEAEEQKRKKPSLFRMATKAIF